MEDGYTFHDYNIKFNDVIQLMVISEVEEETEINRSSNKPNAGSSDTESIIYKGKHTLLRNISFICQIQFIFYKIKFVCHTIIMCLASIALFNFIKYIVDAISKLYEVGDIVDMRNSEQGAWFEGKVVRIVHNPDYVPVKSSNKCNGVSSDQESDSENKPPVKPVTKESSPKKSKNKAIADYFIKITQLSKKKQSELCRSNETDDPGIESGLLYKIHLDAEYVF